jgi:hypothetical protein
MTALRNGSESDLLTERSVISSGFLNAARTSDCARWSAEGCLSRRNVAPQRFVAVVSEPAVRITREFPIISSRFRRGSSPSPLRSIYVQRFVRTQLPRCGEKVSYVLQKIFSIGFAVETLVYLFLCKL